MGARSWLRVSALPRSRVPCILGARARGNANFIQDRGNAEREIIGTLNSRSCRETTGHKAPLPRRHTRTQVCPPLVVKDNPAVPLPPPWKHPQVVAFGINQTSPLPPHPLYWQLQKHRNAKQERGSAGERKNISYRDAGAWNAKEISRNAGTRNAKAHRNARPSLIIGVVEPFQLDLALAPACQDAGSGTTFSSNTSSSSVVHHFCHKKR